MPFFNPSRSTRTLSRKGPITDGTNQTLIFDVFCVFGGDAPYQEPTGNSKHAKACKGVRSVSIMIYYNSIYSDGLDFLTMMLEYVQPCSRSCHSCRSDLKARDSRRHLIVKSIRVLQLIAGWSHESS